MHGLLSDRFLRRFAKKIRRRHKKTGIDRSILINEEKAGLENNPGDHSEGQYGKEGNGSNQKTTDGTDETQSAETDGAELFLAIGELHEGNRVKR
jgi:hypothetical protein